MNALLPNGKHTVPSSGNTYAYIYHAPTQPQKPTLLFIHGFPATSHEWHHQIRHFLASGHGLLVPDCLGYGLSSKPLSVTPYIGRSMSRDIISILDSLSITTVIGIAHDWGTYLLSQLVIWYPERFEKLVFFSVPFSPPGKKVDVKRVNESSKKRNGFEQYGYHLFLGSEEAGPLIGENWEKFYHSLFPASSTVKWAKQFASTNGLKSALLSNSSADSSSPALTPLAPYISPIDKQHHHASFGNDYSAPCLWYRRGNNNLGVDEEIEALKKGEVWKDLGGWIQAGNKKGEERKVLMIAGLADMVCPADHARASMNRFLPGGEKSGRLVVRDVNAGHWIMLEKVEETNRILTEFIEGYGDTVKASL